MSEVRFGPAYAAVLLLVFVTASAVAETADIAGRVVNEDGEPVKNATVLVIRKTWPGGRYRQEDLHTQSDQDGRFRLKDFHTLKQKVAVLVAICHDRFCLMSDYRLDPEGAGFEPFDFQLTKATPVTLVFQDSEGKPVEGVVAYPSGRETDEGKQHLVYAQGSEPIHKTSDASGKVVFPVYRKGDTAKIGYRVNGKHASAVVRVDGSKEHVIQVDGSSSARPTRPQVWVPEPREPDPSHVRWIKRNAVPLRSIDPEDTSFEDLQPIKRLIGEARIVQLGEQSHGDGACFRTKIRLIKFLHQEMGFDVLAFESGLYDCRKAWEAFQAGEPALEAAEQGVFGIWTGSQQVQSLFEYLSEQAKTDRPLELAGFDCQFTASASTQSLAGELSDALKKFGNDKIDDQTLETIVSGTRKLVRRESSDTKLEDYIAALDRARNALAMAEVSDPGADREIGYWRQLLKSIGAEAERRDQQGTTVTSLNARDGQMADNLIRLAKSYYPERKIIVWSASLHIMRNAAGVEVPDGSVSYENTVPMGHTVHEQLGDQVYSIAFIAYDGAAGAWFRNAVAIGPANPGTLEHHMAEAGLENAVLGLRKLDEGGSWLRQKLAARPLGHHYMRANWPNHFDAVIFNRQMTPSTSIVRNR
jgi:erythromycin esterase